MAANAGTTQLAHGVIAVDTEYGRPLQDASHLVIEAGRAAFVDTGVNSSVPLLLAAVAANDLDPGDVDFVFLTHIHLDHAGGAGQLMQALPNARCIVHPRGARHMIDPTRLIAGTKAVYGEALYQKVYGEIVPIAEARLDIADDGEVFSLNGRDLQAFYTEGHARHHYCLHDPKSAGVFSGDSFGVSYREFDTAAGEFIFPTTTPIHFDPVEAHKSIDRILSYQPERVYLTHYSQVESLERLGADMHQGIDDYVALAEAHANDADRTAVMRQAMFDYFWARLEQHGFSGGVDAARAVLQNDAALNVQGLEYWLDHR